MKKIFLILACLVLVSGTVFAAGSKEKEGEGKLHIVVATDATWPPMEYVARWSTSHIITY